jgi:hypothetical protein
VTTRKRLPSRSEALARARAQIRAERVSPKPKRGTKERSDGLGGSGHSTEDNSGPRDRERWITLPKHLSMYTGEQGVIDQGFVWVHRVDRRAARTGRDGVKRTPVRLINLGRVGVLDPNYQRENNGPGGPTAKGDKTSEFVLGSATSGSSDRLLKKEGVLSPLGGRPKKNGYDDLILQLAAEGKGTKAIARTLNRDGISISSRTVSRRLAEIRGS